MAGEVIAATHGNKAHVYWRNFPESRWVDFSLSQKHCKLMIFDRQGDYFVKITTEDEARKVRRYEGTEKWFFLMFQAQTSYYH